MAAVSETAAGSQSSFADLLGSCPMHAGEPATDERLEIRGRIERLGVDGRFVVLVPSARDMSIVILELDVVDVESWEVLVEDSSGRKTCRLVLSQGATLRRRDTGPRLQSELSADPRVEDTAHQVPDSADPIAAWKSATWRTSVNHSLSQSPLPPSFRSASELPQQTALQPYPPSMAQPAYIESYQGQLYYYFPYGYGGDVSSEMGTVFSEPVPYSGAATIPAQPSDHASGYGVTAPAARPCGCKGSAGGSGAQRMTP